MNCRQVRNLISPYLDQQLTGAEMLTVQAHLQGCFSCAQEYQQVREVRLLLRSLSAIRPAAPVETETMRRVREAEQETLLWTGGAWRITSSHNAMLAARPQRGRRLAGALALSCVGLLAIAAPFAPSGGDSAAAQRDARLASSQREVLGSALPPMPLPRFASPGVPAYQSLGSASLAASTVNSLPLPRAPLSRSGASVTLSSWSAEPLGDEAVGGYAAGGVSAAGPYGR